MPATPRGLPYPADDARPDVPADIRALAEWLDERIGIVATGAAAINVPDNAGVYDVAVTFPAGRFTATPRISLAWSSNRVAVSIAGVTVNGMTLSARMLSGVSATAVTVHWTATQR